MKKYCLLLLSCFVFFAYESSLLASGLEDKMSDAVKTFIVSQNRYLVDAKLEIKFKNSADVLLSLRDVKGKVDFKVDPAFDKKKLGGNIIVPVEIYADGNLLKKADLNTNILIFKKVVVTLRRIKRREVISSLDVSCEQKNITYMPDNIMTDLNSVLSKEVVSSIPKDTIMLSWMIRNIPAVKKGDTVKIIGILKNIKVEAGGICLQDGYKGEEIKVKNIDFKKVISARIISSREVEARIN